MVVHALFGNAGSLGAVALKAALLFLTAVIAFRISERRTLAEMGAYDFVAAVAAGAIIGRVPNSSTTSYLQGAVTLVAILCVHAALTRLRLLPHVARLLDHPARLLVVDGRLREREMTRAGLTRSDLLAMLREHEVADLREVRYAIFEQRGKMSVVRKRTDETDGEVSAVPRELARAART